jgi:putative membrane protein
MRFRFLLAATAALALTACDRGPQDPVTLDGLNSNQEKPYAGPMPTDPQGWSTMLSSDDAFLIEAGKLAQSMSREPAVQSFGATLVSYHTQSSAELQAVAAQVQGLSYAPQLTAFQQQELSKLRGAGADFDKVFREAMITAHQEAAWLLQGFAANGNSAPLKAYAAKNAPIVQGHLAAIYKLPIQK